MKTVVVNISKSNYDVYIGRVNKPRNLPESKWANPFKIGPDGSREDVIRKYEEYILNNAKLLNDLPELENKVLGCYCKPKACHGDILVKLLNQRKTFKF